MKAKDFSDEYEYIPTGSSGGCYYAHMVKNLNAPGEDDWVTLEPYPHGPDTEYEQKEKY